MTVLRFDQFGGLIPRQDPTLLPPNMAEVAENVKLWSGTLKSYAESPFNNRYVPTLNDGRFLRGNATAGTGGGSQTQNPSTAFPAANDYTPLGSNGTHSHTWSQVGNAPEQIAQGTGGINASSKGHQHQGTVGAPTTITFTGTPRAHSLFFKDALVNVEPLYFNAKFYQRIK